jgi:serine/threonine protein kinase
MNKYEVIKTIGEGAYGVVLQCRNKESNELVAIKRFKESDEDELVRKTTVREVKVLRLLKDEKFVVHLIEAFRRKGKLYLVFEYVGCNLLEVLEQHPQGLEMEEVRRMIFTLLLGVRACHANSVIHRDIKPENLLLHNDNSLRLCDFGFARIYNNSMDDLTDYVATRWYRSPELLLGTTNYGLPSDMWAIGCIMAELIDGQALFPGESELDQIFMIQKLLGNFTAQQQEVFRKNKRFANETLRDVTKTESTLERKYGRKANKKALQFLKSLLVIDPEKRLTVDEAINHPLFEGLVDTYAPHLKLVTPLIRPSTAQRASAASYTSQQQASAGSSHSQAPYSAQDMPPRPSSTNLDTDTATTPMGQYAIPTTAGLMQHTQYHQANQPPGQLSSRVSQASSAQSLPTQQQQQQARSGAPGSSFLPSRIGSGHRRPPSQQRIREEQMQAMQAPQQEYAQPAPGPYGQSTRGTPAYGQQGNWQAYGAQPQYGAVQMTANSNINPNINAPFSQLGMRGNLPRLGQVPLSGGGGGGGTGSAGSLNFARFGAGGNASSLVNGGSIPTRADNGQRPPPSQQRSRFFYS